MDADVQEHGAHGLWGLGALFLKDDVWIEMEI